LGKVKTNEEPIGEESKQIPSTHVFKTPSNLKKYYDTATAYSTITHNETSNQKLKLVRTQIKTQTSEDSNQQNHIRFPSNFNELHLWDF